MVATFNFLEFFLNMKIRLVYSSFLSILTLIKINNSVSGDENNWLTKMAKQLPVMPQVNSWKQSEECRCGVPLNRNDSERIVGGVVSKPNAWPWMAAIVFMGDKTPKILCGSSVINPSYLLTAAHCAEYLQKQGVSKFRVYLGTNDLNDTDSIIRTLDSVTLHPKFDQKTKAYDIALLKLDSTLEFSTRVSPICIAPQTGAPYTFKEAIVAGWGTTTYGGRTVKIQMQAMVNVTSNKSCKQSYAKSKEKVKITPIMLCASSPGSDSCQGDSGGPLFLNRKGSGDAYEQIGIVSFGSGCADRRYPGVYIRIGKVLSWIKSATKDATYCSMN